jgi:FtsZ-interacting cell division protein ZipA
MPISELQAGLIGAGVVAVVGVFAYGKWQERRHRRQAERVFGAEHPDVLLEPQAASTPTEGRVEPAERDADAAPAPAGRPVVETELRRQVPDLPTTLDGRVDCVIRIESIEPLQAARLWLAQRELMQGVAKPVSWFAFDDSRNAWEEIGGHSAGSHNWFCAAMQMADRRGAMEAGEFGAFVDGVQKVCDQFMAMPASQPGLAEALAAAGELDRFCAGVDVQIGVNVVSTATPFPGTKLRGLAEAQGLALREDGMFHAEDEQGVTLFSMANLEPVLFTTENLRSLQTTGLTLMVDVPRVPNGHLAFDRMMVFARQLAEALNGQVVDDNRAPFGEPAAALIRSQIEQFQGQMLAWGVPAGSRLALRLFSA